MKRLLTWTSLVLLGGTLLGQESVPATRPLTGDTPALGFSKQVFRDEQGGEHPYVLFLPANYSPAKTWPAILFLHGAGECGKDGTRQTTVGLGPYVKEHEASFPAIVIFPQCEETRAPILKRWSADAPDGRRALQILDEVQRRIQVDPQRVALTGWSMGGFGVWNLASRFPKRWSAVVPLAGGGSPESAAALSGVRLWAFHGARDNIVPVEQSRRMIAAVRQAKGNPTYTEFPQGDHGIWRLVYSRNDLVRWMFDPQTIPATQDFLQAEIPTRVPPVPFAQDETSRPFKPAVYVPRAISIRLGNQILSAVSDAIPGMVPDESLSGSLGDISDVTSAQGRSFNVQFSGISYSAKLNRVVIKGNKPDQVLLQVGLQDIRLVIGSTYISGGPRAASAGPMTITIGHVRPVWLSVVVKPEIEGGKVRFRLVNSQFNIPDDNWTISGPNGISTRGLGMTQERVYDGLVSGMWNSKSRIESQVSSVVPSMLTQFEQRVEFSQFDKLLTQVWPLPIAAPRVLTWAQEVNTDETGVTLVLGATLGHVQNGGDLPAPRWSDPLGPTAKEVESSSDLRVGISPQILQPMTQLLVEAQAARINVLDTPAKSLSGFVEPATLTKAIPDVKRLSNTVEFNSELALQKPLKVEVRNAERAVSESPQELEMYVPELQILMTYRQPETGPEWKSLATLTSSVRQPAALHLERVGKQTPTIVFGWLGGPKIASSAALAPEFLGPTRKIDGPLLEGILVAGWKEFTSGGPATRVVVPDLEYGITRLRIADIAWRNRAIVARFSAPPLYLTNKTARPLTYQVKGPFTEWSDKLTIAAGKTTTFEVTYPLSIRYQAASQDFQFTLPVGSNSEIRVLPGNSAPLMYQVADSAPATSP